MTTPAVNLSLSAYVPRYSTWNGYDYSSVEPVNIRKLIRPQSVNNPIRPDGSRQPSNWSNVGSFTRPFTGHGTFHHKWAPWIKGTTSGLAVKGTPTEIDSYQDVENFLANNRLKALSQATESSKNLSAFAASAGKTGKLVGEAATDFSRGLEKIMSGPNGLGSKFGGMSKWKTIPQRYLEYCFGWAPLAGDIENAFDELSNLSDMGLGVRMSLRSRRPAPRQSLVCRNYNMVACFPAGAEVPWVELTGFREAFCPVSYVYDLPAWLVDNVPTISPFSTAWELAPYSFVLDWFVPIGDWFGALEAAQFSPHFREGSETIFIRDTYTNASLYYNNYDYIADSWSASGRIVMHRMRRSSLITAPNVSSPRFKPLPGLQQAAQGLSLLTQTFKRWR